MDGPRTVSDVDGPCQGCPDSGLTMRCPQNHDEFIKSITEDENIESMRGFVYPKTFRNVHRDPNSKFYVTKKDFSKDIYPEYPALSYLMILVITKMGF